LKRPLNLGLLRHFRRDLGDRSLFVGHRPNSS